MTKPSSYKNTHAHTKICQAHNSQPSQSHVMWTGTVLLLRAFRMPRPLQHCENLIGHSQCIRICAERHDLMFVNRTILLLLFLKKKSASVHLPTGVCACFCGCVRVIRGVSEVTDFCYKGPQPKVFLSTSSLCKGHVWSALYCITMDRREGEQGRGW